MYIHQTYKTSLNVGERNFQCWYYYECIMNVLFAYQGEKKSKALYNLSKKFFFIVNAFHILILTGAIRKIISRDGTTAYVTIKNSTASKCTQSN